MNDFNGPPLEDEDENVERSTIEVDIYGIKTKLKPSPGSERPQSWKEVAVRLNGHLMTIAERLLGVFADTFIALGNIVRGIGGVPDAIAQRISGAHKRADALEANRQESARRQMVAVAPASAGETQEPALSLEDVLEELRAKGAAVELFRREDGRWVLVVVRPELLSDAKLLADNSRPNDLERRRQRVKAIFARSGALFDYSIEIEIDQGQLLLSGEVGSYHHKELATELARSAGDLPVVNNLRVTYRAE